MSLRADTSVDALQPAAPRSVDAIRAEADARAPDEDFGSADTGFATPADAKTPTPFSPFDLDVLHDIRIDTTSIDETTLRNTKDDVPCDVEFDGHKVPHSACHRKGSYGSLSVSKPAISITFDTFIPNQKLAGLDHLVFNNAKQDPSFLNEHIGYDVCRRAGLPAPFTAHGTVTLNGKPQGLYVIKEAIVKDFLSRNFGKGNKEGNLYKSPIDVDFVISPDAMILKNEKEDMRSRQDLRDAALLIKTSSDADFEAAVGKVFNLAETITIMAADVILDHFDGPFFRANNYYLYDNPLDSRFVFIPHGMDWLFDVTYPIADEFKPDFDPFAPFSLPLGNITDTVGIARRIRRIPALEAKFHAEVGRVIREAWDEDALNARIDRVVRVVHMAKDRTGPVADNVKTFDATVAKWRSMVKTRKAFVVGKTQ